MVVKATKRKKQRLPNLMNFEMSDDCSYRLSAQSLYTRVFQVELGEELSERRFPLMIHGGPTTDYDRERAELIKQLRKDKYIPMYHKRCKKAGVPRKYWLV